MIERRIPYGKQSIIQSDVDEVAECLRGDWLTQGPRVRAFEGALCEYTGAQYAVAVANGTAALHLAYAAVGLGAGELGVTSPISFVATANGMLYQDARVAFSDVDAETGLIELDHLEAKVAELAQQGRAPRVIAPVHFAGQVLDPGRVARIAEGVGAAVVEDAAHALGASYSVDGRRYAVGSCSHSRATIFSFHPVKHITTGEGGAITTNDEQVYARLLRLRSHGIERDASRFERPQSDPFVGPWYHEQTELGYNYRLTDLQCALGSSQLRRLPAFILRRQEIARRYERALREDTHLAERLSPLARGPLEDHAFHLFVVRLRARPGEALADVARRRKHLFEALHARGVLAQVHYIPIPWQPHHRRDARVLAEAVPGAEAFYASCISLPMYPELSDAELDYVITALGAALEEGEK